MGNASLKELSRQYSEGELSTPEYRQKRTELINEITGDKVSAEQPTPEMASQATRASQPTMSVKIVVLAVAFIVAIIVVWLSMAGYDNKNKTVTKSNIPATSLKSLAQHTAEFSPLLKVNDWKSWRLLSHVGANKIIIASVDKA